MNSLLEEVTSETVVAEVILMRGAGQLVLLVEGKRDALVETFIDERRACLVRAYGVKNLLPALRSLQARSMDGVLGLRDRDLVGIVLDEDESLDLLEMSDLYDVGMDLLSAGNAAERVIRNFFYREDASGKHYPFDAIFRIVVGIGGSLGALRAASLRHNLGIRCSAFPLRVCDPSPEIGIDMFLVADLAVKRTPELESTSEQVHALVVQEWNEWGPERLCSLHDLAAALCCLLRSHWGVTLASGIMESALMAAVSADEFCASRVGQRLMSKLPGAFTSAA